VLEASAVLSDTCHQTVKNGVVPNFLLCVTAGSSAALGQICRWETFHRRGAEDAEKTLKLGHYQKWILVVMPLS
jgi:hypothetical protein